MPQKRLTPLRPRRLREAHRTPANNGPSCDMQTLRSPLAPSQIKPHKSFLGPPEAFKGAKKGPACPRKLDKPLTVPIPAGNGQRSPFCPSVRFEGQEGDLGRGFRTGRAADGATARSMTACCWPACCVPRGTAAVEGDRCPSSAVWIRRNYGHPPRDSVSGRWVRPHPKVR